LHKRSYGRVILRDIQDQRNVYYIITTVGTPFSH